jgi:hypothetical protein
MSDELHVMIAEAGNLPGPTRAALEKAIADYGHRVLADAISIEKARRLDGGSPMVTDTAVALADLNARNGQTKSSKSWKQLAMSLAEYVATFASGGFAGYITKPFGAVGFAVCAVLGVLAHNWNSSHGS